MLSPCLKTSWFQNTILGFPFESHQPNSRSSASFHFSGKMWIFYTENKQMIFSFLVTLNKKQKTVWTGQRSWWTLFKKEAQYSVLILGSKSFQTKLPVYPLKVSKQKKNLTRLLKWKAECNFYNSSHLRVHSLRSDANRHFSPKLCSFHYPRTPTQGKQRWLGCQKKLLLRPLVPRAWP